MFGYRLNMSLLGLQFVIAVLFDAQNVTEGFFEGVLSKIRGAAKAFMAYAFWPKNDENETLTQTASDLRVQLIKVKVRKPGDQSVDKRIFQWIGRIEGAGQANVIAIASTDKGYLRSKEDIRSKNRGLICFGHGRLGKKYMKKYDLYYNLSEKRFQPMDDRWEPWERLELLILLRLAMDQAFKKDSWSQLRDVEEFFDRFQPKWRELTKCYSMVDLIQSLKRFKLKGVSKGEGWVKEMHV